MEIHQNFCASKGTIEKLKKDSPQNGRTYLQIIYLIRNFYPEYQKFLQLNNKKSKKPNVKVSRLPIDISPPKIANGQ